MKITRKFVHGELFEKQWRDLNLTDENLRELQSMLLENPKLGPVISGTGRLRKLRYSYGNRGKSHCARVCYVDFEINGLKARLEIELVSRDEEVEECNQKH